MLRYFRIFALSTVLGLGSITAMTEEAQADPVTGAIIAFTGASGIWATIGTAVLNIGLSFGLSLLSSALGGKADAARDAERPGLTLDMRGGGTVPRSFMLGFGATAGSLIYMNTWGTAEKTPNAYLVMVIALSDLPVTRVTDLMVDGRTVTYDPAAPQGGLGQAIPQYNRDGRDHLFVRIRTGNQTTADSYLTSRFAADPKLPWTAEHVGRGVAYAVVTMRWNEKLFDSVPSFLFMVEGIPLYDLRQDSTAGGSGGHRWSNPATWEYKRWPATMIYNIIRGLTWNGTWFYGGQGVDAAQLPYASWAAAASACAAGVRNRDGSIDPQFRAGGEIAVDEPPLDAIRRLLATCNGRMAESGGRFRIQLGGAPAAIFSFGDADVIVSAEQSATLFPGLDDLVNGVAARYMSPAEGWVIKDAPPRLRPDLEAEDLGRRSMAALSLELCNDKFQVQRLMQAALREERRFRRHTVVLPPPALIVEPLDYVSWTSARNGYDAKLFRVDQVTRLESRDILLGLVEVDPDDYDWDADADELDDDDSPPVFVDPAAQGLQSFGASGVTLVHDDNRKRPAIRVTWDAADQDGVDGVIYRVRRTSGAAIVDAGQVDSEAFAAGSYDITKGLVSDTSYQVRAKYKIRGDNRDATWTSWITVSTPTVKFKGTEVGDDELVTAHVQSEQIGEVRSDNNGADNVIAAGDTENAGVLVTFSGITAPRGTFLIFPSVDAEAVSGNSVAELTIDVEIDDSGVRVPLAESQAAFSLGHSTFGRAFAYTPSSGAKYEFRGQIESFINDTRVLEVWLSVLHVKR